MAQTPGGFIDDYLAYLLAQASHLISHEFHRVARQAGLSVLQWRVLATLVDGAAVSVGDLAQVILTPQSTLTRVADRMSRQGWVERVAHDTDRRITQLRITPAGLHLAQQLVAQAREHEASVLAPLARRDAQALKSSLRRLIELHRPRTPARTAPAAGDATPGGRAGARRRRA